MAKATISSPLTWPKLWRRMFLLTLPISLPVWLLVYTIILCGLIVAAVFIYASLLCVSVWDGKNYLD